MRRALLTLTISSALAAGCANPQSFLDLGTSREAGSDGGRIDYQMPPSITLTGKVRAPNGLLPIAGALVYATMKELKPIPQNVYCDKCVDLEPSTPRTISKADGTFTMKLPYAGKWLIVTQKGSFRRARWLDVTKDAILDQELTMLPPRTDEAKGDYIPRMAVIQGGYDAIQGSLAKLGLGEVDPKGNLIPGTESFTTYRCTLISIIPPRVDCKPASVDDLLTKQSELDKYNILFIPCDSDWLDGHFASATVKANLLRWITAGGRLYVTDWQYDLLSQILPGYITWEGESSEMGSAQLMQPYDAPAIVNNADLKVWLAAQGIVDFKLLESYTIIKSLAKLPTPGPDAPGTMFDVSPKAWMSGDVPGHGVRPMTVSFPYGCGRVLFSSYHTEGDHSTGTELLPQERALLYIILEVAVCLKDPTLE